MTASALAKEPERRGGVRRDADAAHHRLDLRIVGGPLGHEPRHVFGRSPADAGERRQVHQLEERHGVGEACRIGLDQARVEHHALEGRRAAGGERLPEPIAIVDDAHARRTHGHPAAVTAPPASSSAERWM